MRKLLKIAGILAGTLILLILVVAFVVPFLVDANDFKPRIEAAVEGATKRDFAIPGDIRLSVFPWLGVELGAVRLGNAPGFGDAPFATLEGVQVRVKLLPLLARDIKVDKVVIEQPTIRLARDADGRGNWEDLAEQQAPAEPRADAAEDGPAPQFSIDGVEIRDAHVSYADTAAGTEVELTGFDVTTGALSMPADFPLTMSGRVRLAPQELAATFTFKGQVVARPDVQQYVVGDARLELTAEGETLPVSPLSVRLEWRSIRADLEQDTAALENFSVNALGADAELAATVTALTAEPRVTGHIAVAEFSPGQLLVKLGGELPATRDGEVLDRAALAADFAATSNSAVIENLRAVLDQSNLSGRVEVADFEKQALRFDLALDAIDVDRYLPPSDARAAQQAGASKPLDEAGIPAELVRGRDVAGTLSIGRLKAFDFNSTDVRIGITARNDVLRVHPAEAKFYGGGYRGDISVDASGELPVISVDEHVDRIQLAPLSKDVFAVDQISGTAQVDVKATARGKTIGALRRTLAGTFSMDVSDGAIEGFNLWESIREAYAKLKGRDYARGEAPERTEFAELAASGRIDKGVLRNDDLVAKLPFLRVNGKGSIDIAAATLDYLVEARVLKSPELEGGIEELTDTPIPVRLTGPLTAPKVRPDVAAVLEARAKEALEREKRELRERAKREAEEKKKELEEKLKDRLKDLFQ